MEILIAEDDKLSRTMLAKVLVNDGHQVVEAENGLKAWELMQSSAVQIIVTDWAMPEMDGVELCRRVRGASFDKYTYIIVLTAKDHKNDLLTVFESGADDFMAKPFDPQELRARIATGSRVIDLEQRHKGLQGSLLESRNKLRTVLDSLQEEIVAISPDYRIVSVNQSFADRIGERADTIIGKSCGDLGDVVHRFLCVDIIKPLVEKVFAQGQVQHHMHSGKDKSGMKLYKQFAVLPVKNETGIVVQVILVAKDITNEHCRVEEIEALNGRLTETGTQLEAKNRNLENTLRQLETTQAQMLQSEKMASIGQLAAGVAHEINNPTGFVSSNLKTLGDYKQDIGTLINKYQSLVGLLQAPGATEPIGSDVATAIQEVRDFEKSMDVEYVMDDIGDLIGDCREGAERIKKIVMDLKDFAHPGEDKIKSVDINKGLASTLNVVRNEIKYKAEVDTQFGDIPSVSGYPQQLNQVFMNILVNAAQAIEKEGRITVKTLSEDGFVEVLISDTGCGISEENIKKIFDPFFTTKDVGEGTGLGMNIAYNIIHKHNGTLTVRSEVGKGTTFTMRLPVEKEV